MRNIVVKAPEEATVESVKELGKQLLATLEVASLEDLVTLDLSRVRRSDSSLAQLTIAFKAEAEARGLRCDVDDPGDDHSASHLLLCDASCETCSFRSFRNGLAKTDGGRR